MKYLLSAKYEYQTLTSRNFQTSNMESVNAILLKFPSTPIEAMENELNFDEALKVVDDLDDVLDNNLSEVDIEKVLRLINATASNCLYKRNDKVFSILAKGQMIAEECLEITKDATFEKFREVYDKYPEVATHYIYILYYTGRAGIVCKKVDSKTRDYFLRAHEFAKVVGDFFVEFLSKKQALALLDFHSLTEKPENDVSNRAMLEMNEISIECLQRIPSISLIVDRPV